MTIKCKNLVLSYV